MQYMGNYLPLYENSVSEAAFLSQEAGYHFEKYLHTDIDVYLIGSGKCSMDIAGQSVCCAPKDFVMISPYTVHSFSVPEDEECSFYHIQFSPRLFLQIVLIQDTKNPVSLIHSLFSASTFFTGRQPQKTSAESSLQSSVYIIPRPPIDQLHLRKSMFSSCSF